MLATLALVLPLLGSVGAQGHGGDHYVAHRSAVLRRGEGHEKRYPVVPGFVPRAAAPDPAGVGGAHYAQSQQKVAGGLAYMVNSVRDNLQRDAAGNVMFDERGLPITATTTVVIPMTTTEVVWVDPATQSANQSATETPTSPIVTETTATPSPAESSPSVSPSISPPFTGNTNIVLPPESSASGTPSPSVTESPTGSPSPSPSTSVPEWSWSLSSSPSPSQESSSYLSSTSSASSSETATESSASPTSASPTSTSSSASASPSPTGSPGNGNQGLNRRLMNGYWADWTSNIVPPESVDWNRFDVINFAFSIPTYDGRLEFTQANSATLLHRLVKSAHANGKKVVLSVGGWTGSQYFSSIVADNTRSQTFIENIVAAINEYSLDGIDLDWEYPGVPGNPGNGISPDDSANYLVFLRKLRSAVPQNSLITAATQVWPFAGPDGRPMADVSGFAEVFDWILLMNYDIFGASSKPGPNAPLADGCNDSSQPTANAYAAVASWIAAGFPADKITLGVAAYGYVQRSSASQIRHRAYPPPVKRQSVTVTNGDGGTADGQVTFRGLVQQGALSNNGGYFEGAGGFTRNWDECSSTPWLKSASSGQIVTYDDPQSLNMKGQFAAQAGIRGCSMWSVDGDFLNGGWPLTDAVRSGMGI